ncbi:DUF983 domain-containing protein [Rickettsiales bacterium]|nr:DUF983 domain-containing protein [Rickettsiales bacterium]
MKSENDKNPHSLLSVLKRSIFGRCPNCGKGKLFSGYLKVVKNCSNCNEPLNHIRADDGPAWVTILISAHILVPLSVNVTLNTNWPEWVYIITWPAVAVSLILLLLQPAKGAFIGVIWRTKCEGS